MRKALSDLDLASCGKRRLEAPLRRDERSRKSRRLLKEELPVDPLRLQCLGRWKFREVKILDQGGVQP